MDFLKPKYIILSVKNATGGKGFDIVLEMLANVNLNEDLKVAAKRGRIVVTDIFTLII